MITAEQQEGLLKALQITEVGLLASHKIDAVKAADYETAARYRKEEVEFSDKLKGQRIPTLKFVRDLKTLVENMEIITPEITETVEQTVKIIEIVNVTKFVPVFKEGAEANAIQVTNFAFSSGDECGYNVIAQKGLYEIGDPAIYIQPDYCLSDIDLFKSFVAPEGNPNKSRLGKQNRIRAIKFNFSFENSSDPIYSNGILLPLHEVATYLNKPVEELYELNLAEVLGVTKYEEPEKAGNGDTKGDFPSFMYKTDEVTIENKKGAVNKSIENGEEFGITIKYDGSSHTTYFKKIDGVLTAGVCARNHEKKMDTKRITSYKDENGNVYTRYFKADTKQRGWYNSENDLFVTDDAVDTLIENESQAIHDSWVDLAIKSGLLEKGMAYCEEHGLELAFRGEIYGSGLKGSGNKQNPNAGDKQTLRLFGIDDLSEGFAKRINYSSDHNLVKVASELGIEYTLPITIKPGSYDELIKVCDDLFKKEKAEGRVIEGVVIRTQHTNNISVKYMNKEYDANK